MTESRYKIEYVQPEPVEENSFRLFGVLGYLWLALLASVLTYGIAYKHISTSEIISYFQNIKTGVVNTNFSSLTEPANETETALSKESIITDTTKVDTVEIENIENIADTQKLVSEVINDNQLSEGVVFESETVETLTNQTQQEETDSIASEIVKEQHKQKALNKTADSLEPTETIESATATIETEIEETEATIETKPVTQEIITEEAIALEQETNLVKENIVENTTTEEPKEDAVETASIQDPEQKEPELEEKTKEKVEKEVLVEVKNNLMTTLSTLVNDAASNPNKNDLAYIKAVTDYETNKIADKVFLEKIESQENKVSEIDLSIKLKKPENSKVSAVDAIIAAMNADKAAKEKTSLSTQEKLQSEVNLLLKNKNKAESTSQINN